MGCLHVYIYVADKPQNSRLCTRQQRSDGFLSAICAILVTTGGGTGGHNRQDGQSKHSAPVRPKVVLVHEAVEGAVHGFDLVLISLDVHLVEHALLVEIEVPRRLPQLQIGHVRGVQQLVPAKRTATAPITRPSNYEWHYGYWTCFKYGAYFWFVYFIFPEVFFHTRNVGACLVATDIF